MDECVKRKTITECILEDGTVYEYVLCSENRDNDFVDLRFMEYLGIGKKYSAAGSMHVNTEKKYHFWKKRRMTKMDKSTIDSLLAKVELKITFPIGEPIKIDCETHFERDAVCISPEVEDAIVEIALE